MGGIEEYPRERDLRGVKCAYVGISVRGWYGCTGSK